MSTMSTKLNKDGRHIVPMDLSFRQRYWSALTAPIRPPAKTVAQVVDITREANNVLLLGATPEYALALLEKGRKRITVVDCDPLSLSMMRSYAGKSWRQRIHSVEAEWLSWCEAKPDVFDAVVMDCGLLFISPNEYPRFWSSVAAVLKGPEAFFVSRQFVKGTQLECRKVWLDSYRRLPKRTALSSILLTNTIIAARYGEEAVSYPRLQRLGSWTLAKLKPSRLPSGESVVAEMIERFLHLDVSSTDFLPPMKTFPKVADMCNDVKQVFQEVSVSPIDALPRTYQRLVCACKRRSSAG
ncbi:MAG: hypothetical protein CEE38_00810 [Planctomycetes bacterium B3_Pla]|nr:MAG: hypothetical protein CEE38_00810 [Planctomycetes bacterium B3_Pla]